MLESTIRLRNLMANWVFVASMPIWLPPLFLFVLIVSTLGIIFGKYSWIIDDELADIMIKGERAFWQKEDEGIYATKARFRRTAEKLFSRRPYYNDEDEL